MSLTKLTSLYVSIKRKAKLSLSKLGLVGTGMALVAMPGIVQAYSFNSEITQGQSVEDVAENATNIFEIIFEVIKSLGILVGLILVFLGVMRIKKSQDQNSGVSPMQGIVMIIIGGLCAVLPWLLLTSATTVSGG